MERVSVIIPTYNQAQFLAEAIESAVGQSLPPDEILIIDNDSTDNTAEIAARYPQARYVHQPDQGSCGSTNRGIRDATGYYVVILHSDDRLLPHHLETSLRAFQAHPEAAFVCGDYRWFGAEGTWHVHRCRPQPDYYGTLLRLNFIGPPVVVMFKRHILLHVGGLRDEFDGAEDQELYLRIARTYPVHCHHEVIAEYRRHPAQASQKLVKMLAASTSALYAQQPYIKGHPHYTEAYWTGIRHRQQLYGEAIFWEGVRSAKAGHWGKAARCLLVLAQYDRHDLINPLYRKLSRLFERSAPIQPS